MDTITGLTTVTAVKSDDPRFVMTCTMTRPTTSSIIAALVSTVPRRVADRPLVLRMVKVVPKLVEQSAAPAAKACNGVASTRPCSEKDRAIGMPTPVAATALDRTAFALTALKSVLRPPGTGLATAAHDRALWKQRIQTFVYEQN